MAVNPNDAQALQGVIPETDSAGNPISRGSNADTVNAMFPNLPQGAQVVADNGAPSSGGFVSDALGSLAGANPIGQVLGAGKDAVGAVFNAALANTDVNSNGVDTKFDSNPDIAKDRLASRLQLNPYEKNAETATENIGKIEGEVATPVGKAGVDAGLNLTDQGIENLGISSHDFNQSMNVTGQSLVKASNDLDQSEKLATIDPNRYLSQMGVGSRALTAIGLLVSGAGSGLTGQSNLANDMLQKNIDRDIAAQKQTYLNAYNQFLGHNHAAQTSLQRAQAAAAAQNMAVMTVSTGYSTALNGLQVQMGGLTANDKVNLAKYQLLQSKLVAKQNIDNSYIGSAKTSDVATMNMLNGMARAASNHLNFSGVNRFSLTPRNQATERNYSLPPAEQAQPSAPQDSSMQPQEPEANEGSKPSFLDKIAGVFNGKSQPSQKYIDDKGNVTDD